MTQASIAALLSRFNRTGQGLAEYALILGLVAVAAVFALVFLGGVVTSMLSLVGKRL